MREFADAGMALPPALIHYRLSGLGRAAKIARMIAAIDDIGPLELGKVYSVEPSRIRSRGIGE